MRTSNQAAEAKGSRVVYVKGAFVPEQQASVSVFDRGLLFADSVYEVTSVIDGRLIDFAAHMQRLRRSLGELAIELAVTDEELLQIHRQLLEENNLTEGIVYCQVSRGEQDREFIFHDVPLTPNLILFTQQKNLLNNPVYKKGLRVTTQPDLRWGRCDIKTTQLLYSSMVKSQVKAQGFDDAWLIRDGFVNEGTSSNVWLVLEGRRLVTPSLSHSLLAGITRAAIMRFAHENGYEVVEASFTVAEAKAAQEAFVTSATSFVFPVISIDGSQVGDGAPGKVASELLQIYINESLKHAI